MNAQPLAPPKTIMACAVFMAALASCGGRPQSDSFCSNLAGATFRSTNYLSVTPLQAGAKHQLLEFHGSYFLFPGTDHGSVYSYTCEGDTVSTSNNMEFVFSEDLSQVRMTQGDSEPDVFMRMTASSDAAINCSATNGKIYVLPEVAENAELTLDDPDLPYLEFDGNNVAGRLPWSTGTEIIESGVHDCLMGEFHLHRTDSDIEPLIIASGDDFETITVTYAGESFDLVPANVLREPVWGSCRPLATQFVLPTPPPDTPPVPTPSWSPRVPVPNPIYNEETREISIQHTEMASSIARDVATALFDEIRENPLATRLPSHLFWTPSEEFLYGERFEHTSPETLGPFKISMGLAPSDALASENRGHFQLGINIGAEELVKDERPNTVITFLVHAPGQLTFPYYRITADHQPDFESVLSIAQEAMFSSLHSLKEGDVLNLVTVNEDAQVNVNQWHFKYDDCTFVAAVGEMGHFPPLTDLGSLSDGLSLAYEVALDAYDPAKINQLVMIAPRPEADDIDSGVIAGHASLDGDDGIRFSALDISRFGDIEQIQNLITLTELGRGSYSSMLSPQDARRIMTDGFGRFFAPAATDYEITLEFPDTLEYEDADPPTLYEPHISGMPARRFSHGARQLFLENFSGSVSPEDSFQLTINYTDSAGTRRTASLQPRVRELLNQNQELLKSANLLVAFADIAIGQLTCSEFFGSVLDSGDFETETSRKYLEAINVICGTED